MASRMVFSCSPTRIFSCCPTRIVGYYSRVADGSVGAEPGIEVVGLGFCEKGHRMKQAEPMADNGASDRPPGRAFGVLTVVCVAALGLVGLACVAAFGVAVLVVFVAAVEGVSPSGAVRYALLLLLAGLPVCVALHLLSKARKGRI